MDKKCFCGSGKSHSKCHMEIEEESYLARIYRSYSAFDKEVYKSHKNANCLNGCSECCNHFFFISENEFLLILDFLEAKGGIQLIKEYIKRAKDYELYMKENFPKIMKDLDDYMEPSRGQCDYHYFDDDYKWSREKECIFLEKGKCSIYKARPSVCRGYGVSEYCDIIDKEKQEIKAKKEMINSTTFVEYNHKHILKRGYPIFYWFSFFLSEKYMKTTNIKLQMIRKKSQKEYYELSQYLANH